MTIIKKSKESLYRNLYQILYGKTQMEKTTTPTLAQMISLQSTKLTTMSHIDLRFDSIPRDTHVVLPALLQ